ncbi:MAG TPA: DNA polymerase III subunit delta' [Steroidobacteraceae bacterium]|nr:DNA polymerase III subunit delta' [Steroidobacteraceae bacterium]
MTATQLQPWHAAPLSQVRSAWDGDRLPHAILLHGAEGLDKSGFAAWLAQAVLCDTPGSPLAPCDNCASCTLVQAGSHPDLTRVVPPPDKQNILIDQIRAACEQLALTSYRQGRKVAIVEPAHRMTVAAANSLLKTLEEPTPRTHLLLVTSQPASLPATIRSRCLRLGFRPPEREVALAWLREHVGSDVDPVILEFAGGAPVAARALAEGAFADLDERMRRGLSELIAGRIDVSVLASEWAARDLEARLKWLEFWCSREIRTQMCGTAEQVTLAGSVQPLPSRGPALNISSLYGLFDAIRELRLVLSRTALQKELAIESLLIRLLRSIGPAASRPTGQR